MTDPWTPGPYCRIDRMVYVLNEHGFNRWDASVQAAFINCPREEQIAVARLFAAAPDLVEALDDLMAEQNGPPLCDPRHERAWQRAMDNATAVLARVRGETKEQP